MKHPTLIVCLLYVGGIIVGNAFDSFHASLPIWPMLAALATLAGIGLLGVLRAAPAESASATSSEVCSRPIRTVLGVALVVAGVTNFVRQTTPLSPLDLRTIAPPEPALATVRGHLVETPIHRLYSHQDEVSHRTQAELVVEIVRWKSGDWQPVDGRLAVSTAGVLPPVFFAGSAVEIEGVLRPPPGQTAPGAFDYAAYLRRHGIHYQLQCAGPADWRLLDVPVNSNAPFADRFNRWAMAMLARGLPTEDQPLQLLWAMTLGWRTALTGEVSEPFMRSGTMHVFAISGLHIMLITSLLVSVLRVCRMPRRWCALVVIPIIWFYTGATGWQASAIRSTIMSSVIVAGWLLTRPSDLLNSLAAAAFIILLWDPQQLFQAGFQLSFAVVLSLALLGPWLDALRRRLFRYDPWVPDDLRPRWQRWLRRPIDYLTTSFAVSLAAWLGSLPLVAGYFNLLTPVSLVANLVVVPLSSGALACSLGSLVIGPFAPYLGELFNHSAWFLMALMIRASEWSAAASGGCFHVPTPNPLDFLVYYGALVGMLAGLFRHPRWRRVYAGTLIALATVAVGYHLHERAATRLTILPLNGGAALHLASPQPNEDWLIDCGDDSSAGFVLKPYLRAQGVNRLENLLITHGDVHHAGGIPVVRAAFRLDHAWFSPVPFRSTIYRAHQRELSEHRGLTQTLHRNQIIPPWKVLHPDDHDHLPQADDNTVVLLGEFSGTRVLLLSDLGKPGQNLLLSRYPDLRADIVVSGIPTQSEPLADALLEAVQPKQIIVADAIYPASRRANARLRERLAAHAIPVLYTRDTGAITITFHQNGWTLSPE